MTALSPQFAARPRSRRGEGGRLREDIVAAAASMLAESGDAHQLTLRGVAKRVGISAPSIYRHFPDMQHLAMAVVERAFTTFAAARDRAGRQAADPAARLLAGCRAYCQFAIDHPGEYRFMFSADAPAASADADSDRPPVQMAVFHALADSIRACQDAGLAAATDSPDRLAAEIWAALHGLALLRLNAPSFPWPAPTQEMADQVVSRILILDVGNCRDHRPRPGQ